MSPFFEQIAEKSRQSPAYAVFISLILFLLSIIILVPLLVQLIAGIWGWSQDELMMVLEGNFDFDLAAANGFRIIQFANQILTWGFIAWAMGYILGNPVRVLALDKAPRTEQLLLAALTMLLSFPLVQFFFISPESFQLPDFMADWEAGARLREQQSQAALMNVLSDASIVVFLVNLIVFALTPAICEEILFRGFLQQQLAKSVSPHLAVIISAFVFSFIHLQFYGFFSRMILGMLLGYFLLFSGSLWPGIFAHFVFNATSVIVTFLANGRQLIETEYTSDDYEFPWYAILISAIAVSTLLFLYSRWHLTKQTPPNE